jgi:hypothetical protein
MLSVVESFIINYILSMVLSQVQVLEGKIDWVSIKASADALVNKYLVGFLAFMEPGVQKIVDDAIAKAQAILQGQFLASVLADLAQGKFAQALADLEAAVKA